MLVHLVKIKIKSNKLSLSLLFAKQITGSLVRDMFNDHICARKEIKGRHLAGGKATTLIIAHLILHHI